MVAGSTPNAPPVMTPMDADALEAYWYWPLDWWHDAVVPDYGDVQNSQAGSGVVTPAAWAGCPVSSP